MKSTQYFLVIASTASLVACSPARVEPNTYLLDVTTHQVSAKRITGANIMVMPPDAETAYNTAQMAYSTEPYKIAYYARNEWAATPASMLQPLIVQSLQNSHHYHAVVTPPYIGHYDYLLSTHLIELEQDFTVPATLRLAVRAQLVRMSNNQVVATRVFNIEEPMHCKTPYYGVLAANRATSIFLNELTQFSVKHT